MKYAAENLEKRGIHTITESEAEPYDYTLYPPPAMAAGDADGDPTAIPYFSDETHELKNALLTAEAALALIITETPSAVHQSDFLIIGYGRIGKFTANYIRALGGNVTVYARKSEVRAAAECCGCKSVSDLDDLSGYSAVVNTAPAFLLSAEKLEKLSADCLLLELASRQCYDAAYAERAELRAIWARGLPGRFSPVTAGRLIAESAVGYITARHGSRELRYTIDTGGIC